MEPNQCETYQTAVKQRSALRHVHSFLLVQEQNDTTKRITHTRSDYQMARCRVFGLRNNVTVNSEQRQQTQTRLAEAKTNPSIQGEEKKEKLFSEPLCSILCVFRRK